MASGMYIIISLCKIKSKGGGGGPRRLLRSYVSVLIRVFYSFLKQKSNKEGIDVHIQYTRLKKNSYG